MSSQKPSNEHEPSQTPEARAFIDQILALPSGPAVRLDGALDPFIKDESALRRIYATDRANARISGAEYNATHVGLVDAFAAPPALRSTRARAVDATKKDDLSAQYVMPLRDAERRADGTPSTVLDLDTFKRNWSLFTENSLGQFSPSLWNNVVAAGGSVLACLLPVPEAATGSKRATRKYYHNTAYPASDVDLFLWGLTPGQAEAKMQAIYEAVRDSVPWEVTCVRTKHTVSIHSQYPYRSIQIVLRLYQSPAEILAGFDVDCACVAYDGSRVYASPRALVALMRQCNTVDMSRRSPSYEVRLAKYARRGFEVYVPGLRRNQVDPTIFERAINRIQGLARLLVLEKLTSTSGRDSFLHKRRLLRGRPQRGYINPRRRMKKYKGDLKTNDDSVGSLGGLGLEMNDYDVGALHVPYGPRWDARRIEKLVYGTDLGMNSTFNPKNKGRRLHRHPAFFGTMEECMDDCCGTCPVPMNEEEHNLQDKEDESYIRGRIQFIQENPGRQTMSGSFNPIDVGEWSEQVYVGRTERFFTAVARNDRAQVAAMLKGTMKGSSGVDAVDINRRDHVGRTSLHVAIFSGATDVALHLIDAGARISARLVDGRNSLHLAVQNEMEEVVKKLLERSVLNTKEAEAKEAEKAMTKDGESESESELGPERDSSEDDWDSDDPKDDADDEEDDGGQSKKKGSTFVKVKPPTDADGSNDTGDLPEESLETPDILDVNAADWDTSFAPLHYAVISSLPSIVQILLDAGADASLLAKSTTSTMLPLELTLYAEDEERACEVAEKLIRAGAACTTTNADRNMLAQPILSLAVTAGKVRLLHTFLRCDPNAKTALDFPTLYGNPLFPITAAVCNGDWATIAVMLANGVNLDLSDEDVERARRASTAGNYLQQHNGSYFYIISTPTESALCKRELSFELLLAAGADPNRPVQRSNATTASSAPHHKANLLDAVRSASKVLAERISLSERDLRAMKARASLDDASLRDALEPEKGWAKVLHNLHPLVAKVFAKQQRQNLRNGPVFGHTRKQGGNLLSTPEEQVVYLKEMKSYYEETEQILLAHGAKTWQETHPGSDPFPEKLPQAIVSVAPNAAQNKGATPGMKYRLLSGRGPRRFYRSNEVVNVIAVRYDALFEAAYMGDNDTVQRLCLPPADGSAPVQELLQISVEVYDPTLWSFTGFTPLVAAVMGKQWKTAKLILAIVASQYKSEDEEIPTRFNTDVSGFDDEDEDDDDEEGSDEYSDTTVDALNFTDIAKRSGVKCEVKPIDLIEHAFVSVNEKEEIPMGNLLQKAMADNDLDLFNKCLALYDVVSEKPSPSGLTMLNILIADRVEMLDVYIRRYGEGLDIPDSLADADPDAAETVSAEVGASKMYLGLTVHGKKRKDLARMNDPNATNQEPTFRPPLIWSALQHKALSVFDYLCSDRPLEAYRFFASKGSSGLALRIAQVPDLQAALPKLLGWRSNAVNESPLTAAVLSHDPQVLMRLFEKEPKMIGSALHTRIKFIQYNILHLAAAIRSPPAMFDYILSKKVSPLDSDFQGSNVVHILARHSDAKLLSHILRAVPGEVVLELLSAQTKIYQNTPLQLAVKNGRPEAVKAILAFGVTSDILLARDIDGSTALHTAVQYGRAAITKSLLEHIPLAALHLENGVGETALEIAAHQYYSERMNMQLGTGQHPRDIPDLPHEFMVNAVPESPFKVDDLEKNLDGLKKSVDDLLLHDEIKADSGVGVVLLDFMNKMESKIAHLKAEPALPTEGEPDPSADGDASATPSTDDMIEDEYTAPGKTIGPMEAIDRAGVYKAVSAAVAVNPGPRALVHLLDAQAIIQSNLAAVSKDAPKLPQSFAVASGHSRRMVRRAMKATKLEDEKEDAGLEERKQSMVFTSALRNVPSEFS